MTQRLPSRSMVTAQRNAPSGPDETTAPSSASPSRPAVLGSRQTIARGAVAGVAAAGVVTAVVVVAKAAGAGFQVPAGGESIPLVGFAFVTLVATGAAVLLALGLRRWAARPARTFVMTSLVLTAASCLPPWAVGAHAVTAAALSALHLLVALIVVPALGSSLPRTRPR